VTPSARSVVPTVAATGITMLREAAAFARCLDRRPLLRDGAFALHVSLQAVPDPVSADDVVVPAAWRLGLVIPKRYEASAVARNTIKRRWRAAFARIHTACAGEFGAADVVVRLQAPLVPKSAPPAVKAALASARGRARLRFDPQAMLASLVERLRRGGRPSPRGAIASS
jgi:RNase P protein component